MPDCGPAVRFSGYPVEGVVGVNWRLTRFVGEVPSARVCGLCRVVPYRILWLPCGHSMCQSCCSANSQDAERRCPLDQKQFDNFSSSVLTEDEAKTLKVHCWNEAHGCKFEGNMGNMLEHYEKQCTAHIVECPRCGKSVPHTEISTHYMTGCTASASGFPGELIPSPESASLPLGDMNASDEELEALLREPMSEIQSQMKELMEHVSSQQSKLAEITRDVAAAEHNLKAEMDQVAARICSALSDQLRSQRIPAEVPGASSPGTLQETSERMLILRKLEIFADMSLSTMENLRQQSLWQRDPGRVTASCEPQVRECRYLHLTKARATLCRRSEGGEKVKYIMTLKNCDERTMSSVDQNVAQVTVPHTRDAYFTVLVSRRCTSLLFRIAFCAMLGGTETSAPSVSVCAVRKRTQHTAAFVPMDEPSGCEEYGESLVHFHRAFHGNFERLKDQGFIENGELQFEIKFTHTKKVPPADTSTHPA